MNKKIKEILNIIFDLIEETINIRENQIKKFKEILGEDNQIINFKLIDFPKDKLIQNLDEFLDEFIDFEKYPYAGKNFDYFIFEKNIFYKNQIQKEEPSIICPDKEYYIRNKKECIVYLMEEIIPQFIKEKNITEKEFIIQIVSNIFIFYKEIIINKETLLKFLNNYTDEKIEEIKIFEKLENIFFKIENINKNKFEGIILEWINKYKFGENIQNLKFYSSIEKYKLKEKDYEIKNSFDFYNWLIFDFKKA